MTVERVILTGAAGRVGSVLREPLRQRLRRLVSVDRVPLTALGPDEEVHRAELTGVEDVVPLLDGADAVVHLAGVPDEAPLADLLEANVLGAHHVLEAARRTGTPRVVLASSNRLTGCYPAARTVSAEAPPRPDGLYGVSKVAVEALGRLYADKFGLQVVCLRIGSLEPEPSEPRHLATWLSPDDCVGFVWAALTQPGVTFTAAYAVSANTRRFWELDDRLGYRPRDDAEAYAHRIPGAAGYFAGDRLQGGEYATADYTLRHAFGSSVG
ncbi:NAD-dependent epimerase/dehydratase family protein [Thermostaphylospora chromogena]|uniref:Uronate dehydrogenase n=1 Tax=Thermostaphylospora chromogena TaxID=35622 RepID=A0A1H1GQ72_9ACTN|nr:NAD(P)-dependent oxidoreductase [Thermostaphylospora chromogena]SDR15299.1 uronate dehydrogenase [Thermostaphylospora chromogena]